MEDPKLEVKSAEPKGRGVFARRAFAEGEIVEEAAVVLLDDPFEKLPGPVQRIIFNWLAPTSPITQHALVLGFGSLYNHANPAAMCWEVDPANLTIKFIAVRNIAAGEELTINYNAVGGGAVWYENNWFDRLNVKLIN